MKRFVWILAVLLTVMPAWAANKKITVQQLKDLLGSLQQDKKTDAEVADRLKKIGLSEELTDSAVSQLGINLLGPLTHEQLEILKGKSAFLAPPPTDIPATPAPDAAAQKAILAKAADFASRIYAQNPHLSVFKTTLRFEDTKNLVSQTSAFDGVYFQNPAMLIEKRIDPVEIDNGVEKAAASPNEMTLAEHGVISQGETGPDLSAVFQDAISSGRIEWLRWQTINGRQTAVFSFAVEKNNSHFSVSYCCFPSSGSFFISGTPIGSSSSDGSTSISGKVTQFIPFKNVVGYRGEFFIHPETGAVTRLITHADLRPSDYVSREDRRIDYGPVSVSGNESLLPRGSITYAEMNPVGLNADTSGVVHHMLLSAVYQNYKLGEAR